MSPVPLAEIRKRNPLLRPGIIAPVRALLACLLAVLVGCSSTQTSVAPLGQSSFAQYQAETRAWLEKHRHFQSPDKTTELDWNMPREWRPAGAPTKGILLVHGLGDSPWSFSDLGPVLARQGFLVRSVLLPGHGTQPADLMHPSLEDWRQVVREQAAIMAREVKQVYLGGFSTGANLVVNHALDNPEIAGLVLFSPAFKSDSAYDWLAPWIAWARPWLRKPDASRPQQTAVRYLNTPTNGFAQFYRSSMAVCSGLARKSYDKPALLVTVRHDSVLDVGYTLETFTKRFTHPASRMIWYGSLPEGISAPPRVLVRSDYLPEKRISQFSHMGVLFSPSNPLYGEHGSLRLCWNGQDAASTRQCMEGAQIWYSAWGHREPGKVHARLTFNPYFDWQAEVMAHVLMAAERDATHDDADAHKARILLRPIDALVHVLERPGRYGLKADAEHVAAALGGKLEHLLVARQPARHAGLPADTATAQGLHDRLGLSLEPKKSASLMEMRRCPQASILRRPRPRTDSGAAARS